MTNRGEAVQHFSRLHSFGREMKKSTKYAPICAFKNHKQVLKKKSAETDDRQHENVNCEPNVWTTDVKDMYISIYFFKIVFNFKPLGGVS